MTLPFSQAKQDHRGKTKGNKGRFASTEPKETPEISTDATERVLAAVKGLKQHYEQHYAEISSRVKQSIEGPVKTFTMDDGMPIVMQLSVWDTKLGPATAMLVGDADEHVIADIADDPKIVYKIKTPSAYELKVGNGAMDKVTEPGKAAPKAAARKPAPRAPMSLS